MANPSGKQTYEEQWRQAFEKAEMPPAPDIWKNIDQQLTAQEGGKYRRGFFFYRGVAAALLLCLAGLGWYIIGQQKTENVAQQTNASTETPIPGASENMTKNAPEAAIAQRDPAGETAGRPSDTEVPGTDVPGSREGSLRGSDNDNSRSVRQTPTTESPLATLDAARSSEANAREVAQNGTSAEVNNSVSKTLIFPNEEVGKREAELHSINHRVGQLAALSPGALSLAAPAWADSIEQLYYVPQYREKNSDETEKDGIQFFAGLAMAPSFFDPNFQSPGQGNEMLALNNAPNSLDASVTEAFYNTSVATPNRVATVDQAGLDNRSTLSMSYGFDVGFSLGEHWSVESGLDYQNFQTSTETNFTVVDVQTGERYPLLAANAMTSRATYANTTPINSAEEVANNFQFVSVPLKLGYNLNFSRVTLSVSPGVAANFFLGNSISSERYAQTVVTNESSSPFNAQYLSALISGGVFYKILENYSVSFTPSYQFALSELTKNSATFSSLPQSFGLKLGFRYNFQ